MHNISNKVILSNRQEFKLNSRPFEVFEQLKHDESVNIVGSDMRVFSWSNLAGWYNFVISVPLLRFCCLFAFIDNSPVFFCFTQGRSQRS